MSTLLRRTLLILALIAGILGIVLRFYPGRDRFIWSYDQARDEYVIRSIIADRNIVITGPQTEYFGLSHGPLFYYLLAPFYFLSKGDPNLPGKIMGLINLSTIIPLYLLTQALWKKRGVSILAVVLFLLSYQQLEYSRWISNVSVAIPCLTWGYYFLVRTLSEKPSKWAPVLLGLSLGLATQAELFYLSIVAFVGVLLILRKQVSPLCKYIIGLALGLSPFIASELKFHFLGSRIFLTQFLGGHANIESLASTNFLTYLDHLGLTMKQTLAGLSNPMGLLLFFVLISTTFWMMMNTKEEKTRNGLGLILMLFLFHAILFTFHFVNAVFLDMGITIPILILGAFWLGKLNAKHLLGAVLAICLITASLGMQYKSLLFGDRPFATYGFIQDGILYKQKMQIIKRVYALTEGKQFTFASIGTPYGVRTVWASLFEQYHRRTGKPIPSWYGFAANGYPGESLMPKTDAPGEFQVLIIESNTESLLPETILNDALKAQNEATHVVSEDQLYGFKIQLRVKNETKRRSQ